MGTLLMRTPEGAIVGTDGVATEIPGYLRLQAGPVVLEAAEEGEDGKPKARRFAMRPAYSGAPVDTWWGKFVIDLTGMDLGPPAKPILREHMRDRAVGQSDSVAIDESGIVVDGTLSRVSADGREVEGLGDEGFPFQSSIGFDIFRVEFIEGDDSKKVNGADFHGPGYVATKSFLREASFVSLGADKDTASVVLAGDDGGRLVEVARRVAVPPEEGHMVQQNAAGAAAPDPADTGGDGDMTRLARLRKAYPDHQGFALEQFDAGHDVGEAAPAFAALMSTEAAETNEAQAARIRELEAQVAAGGSPGTPFAAGEIQDRAGAPAGGFEHLDSDERAAKLWETDPAFRAQFQNEKEAGAYLRAETGKCVRIFAPATLGTVGAISGEDG